MKFKISYLTIAICILAFLACNNQNEYVELEFQRQHEVKDSVWTKIDDITYINSPHDFEWKSKNILETVEGEKYTYIPTTVVFYYHPQKSEKRVTEKVSNFHIGMKLWNKMKTLQIDGKPIYKIVHPKLLTIQGKVTIQRTDGKKIKIQKSVDNLVSIRRLTE